MSLVRDILILLLLAAFLKGQAQTADAESGDFFEIYFPQSKWHIDTTLHDNASVLDSIDRKLTFIQSEKSFYMDLRSNLLYDALLLPNIGVEFYLGKNLSLGANWMYGWWSKDIKHIYWRAYGGELNCKWWFGKEAHEKPLTGLHLGIYGQYYLYDFELGGKGKMAGNPEQTLWKQGLYGGGVEFGYSLPIKRRLNLDFAIGIGYSGGTYHKYIPIDTHYVWQGTFRRNYVGPTKLELALVWLIGKGNLNREGGGR